MNLRLGTLLGLLCSFSALAGSDPVSWSLSPASGFPATRVGDQSVVFYRFTNNIPCAKNLVMSSKITGGNFIIHDDCSNKSIAYGGSCDVLVAFNPAKAGNSTFQLTYGYDNNRITLPTLTAVATGDPAIAHLGGVIRGLPAAFYQNTAVDFTAIYTNTGNVDLTSCTFSNFTSTGVAVTSLATSSGIPVCGPTLSRGASCQMNGTVTSSAATGLLTISGGASCTAGTDTVTVTPKASSVVKTPSGICTVHASVELPLPAATYKFADNVVQFKFENECTSAVTLGPVSVLASGINATVTLAPYSPTSVLNNCGSSLAASSECIVTASIIPQDVGQLTVTGSVTPSGKAVASAQTGAVAASNQQPTHHIAFVNQCNFDVWYGIGNAAGASGAASPDPNLQQYPNGAPASAYYLPAQIPGQAPSVIDLTVNEYKNGALWPRTGCTMQGGQLVCATGTCATLSNSATCVSGTTSFNLPLNPLTKIEGTLVSTAGGDGVYDVSVINGMTVPVEMKAFGPSTGNTAGAVYNCSAAGAPIQPLQSNALGVCSWAFDPSSAITSPGINNDFYWVTPGADDNCSSSATPALCGMAFNTAPPTNPSQVVRKNGNFLGFSTLANYIGYSSSGQWGSHDLYTAFGMNSSLPSYGPPQNYTVLLGCIYDSATGTANSCNLNSLTTSEYDSCCGCVNWPFTTPAYSCGNGSSQWPGGNTNSLWTTTAVPGASVPYTIQQAVTWLKTACPTAYTYQFDDPSSSFQCNNDGNTQLNTSYEITFCPAGLSGLPTGAADGRGTPP